MLSGRDLGLLVVRHVSVTQPNPDNTGGRTIRHGGSLRRIIFGRSFFARPVRHAPELTPRHQAKSN